jgi:hypothetical protein
VTSKWFVQGSVGVGWLTLLQDTFSPSTGPQITYGASTGYKLYAHTFAASFNRYVGDIYGVGSSATENASGAWAWKIPGGSISVSAGFGYSRLINSAFVNNTSLTGNASVGKALNSYLVASVSYNYMRFPASLVIAGRSNVSQSAVMVSLSWSPSERR